jgi:carbon monoxide dehydrogenase subunit G
MLGEPTPGTYEGEVKVKVGPLGVAYTGEFTVLDADKDALKLTMRGKGREQRGAGNADAHIVAQLSDQNGGTLVQIDTDLSIRGKVAQFGRGVIGEVTDGIMQTFARNVETMLTEGGASAPSAPAAVASTSTDAPTSEPAAGFSGAEGEDDNTLDAWGLVVRPLLTRHTASLVTIALSAVGAYIGARLGARAQTQGGARAGTPRQPRRVVYRYY